MPQCRLSLLAFALVAGSGVTAWPWVANLPGVDTSLLHRGYPLVKRDDPTCPFNADHPYAAPYDDRFPYTGAKFGLPGTGIGGVRVPAEGDIAHEFVPPGPGDIRGPCPGMNTAANHNFLSHDGITNFTELVDAQQNLYNLGYDLAVFIAVRGIALDGDPVTERISIGCDATSRTALLGDAQNALGPQPGLNAHNKFEGDTSLTRRDFFLNNGDAFTFQGDMFADFKAVADEVSGGLFDRATIAKYRANRWDDSFNNNPNFYFGPKAILLYGAASFVYEVMPRLGPDGTPDLETISTFFGAVPNGSGGYDHVPERLPANWTNREVAYTIPLIADEIRYQYAAYPKLFGGNAGKGNFLALQSFGPIVNGSLPDQVSQKDIYCLLYQLATDNVPGTVANEAELPLEAINYIITKLNPIFANSGCPIKVP